MSGNILLVDDLGVIRLSLKRMLEDAGYAVFEAARGGQVINQTFHSETRLDDIDIILLDLYLPDYDGRKVLKFLNKDFPDIPVIIVSIESKKEKIIELIDLGANDYLVKPINKTNLLSRVEKFLITPKKSVSKEISSEEVEEKLSLQLLEEIDRAVRTNSSLVLMSFSGDSSALKQLYDISNNKLRRIDTVMIKNDLLFIILPATNEKGSDVVLGKLFAPLDNDYGDFNTVNLIYPRDADKELIKQYKIEEIRDEFLSRIMKSD